MLKKWVLGAWIWVFLGHPEHLKAVSHKVAQHFKKSPWDPWVFLKGLSQNSSFWPEFFLPSFFFRTKLFSKWTKKPKKVYTEYALPIRSVWVYRVRSHLRRSKFDSSPWLVQKRGTWPYNTRPIGAYTPKDEPPVQESPLQKKMRHREWLAIERVDNSLLH